MCTVEAGECALLAIGRIRVHRRGAIVDDLTERVRALHGEAGGEAGQQPRFVVNGNPQRVGNIGPYSRMYLRNPGIDNQDLSVFKNFPFGGEGKRYLQFRFEAFNVFNHPQFVGYNLNTNVTNGSGQTGSAIFNNFTNLAVTNNLRPAGSTAVLGTYFGEYNGARDPRIIQLAVKFYF